jgi:DNA invertase Pin-like site-specific DNA recombinase
MATSSLPVRCVLYARTSTSNGGQHPKMQLAELREHAQRRGWSVVGEFTDQISGSKDSRPALNKLMAQAHRREFDVVLVWKLDRWGRSLKHLVNSLAELDSLGVAFVSLRDNFDLTTPSGRLMFSIVGAMAEFERALIQERVKAGIAHARARGKRLGRPSAKLDVELINSRRAAGASWRAISRELGVHATTALRAQARCSENPIETAVLNV